MKLHKWDDIKNLKMTPERIKASEARVTEELIKIRLAELREVAGATQEEVAERMESRQSEVSKIENRTDHMISTLRRYVEALGGKLEVTAVVKGKRVTLVEV